MSELVYRKPCVVCGGKGVSRTSQDFGGTVGVQALLCQPCRGSGGVEQVLDPGKVLWNDSMDYGITAADVLAVLDGEQQ